MELTFKTRNPKQIEAAEAWLDPDVDEILYGGAKGGAKSYTGVSLIFGSAHTYPETNWFIARKELIDLKRYTIPSIHEVHQHWGLDVETYLHFDGQLSIYTLPNKSKVYLISCAEIPSDPLYERFGSMQMTGGWIEEAGEVPEAAKENLKISIGRWKNDVYGIKGKMFITANPKKGWLKRDFVDPWKNGVLPKSRRFIPALATDNPYLPESYVNTLANISNRVSRERLYSGNWDYEDDIDFLVSTDALSDIFSNTVDESDELYLIVDVGRKRDRTVFSFWSGLKCYKIIVKGKQGLNKTEEDAKLYAATERIPYSRILIDDDGIGGGVVDNMDGVKPFNGNAMPIPTKTQIQERRNRVIHSHSPKTVYKNLKAQCGWKMAELINSHQISVDEPELKDDIINELTALLRDKDPEGDGTKQLRAKKEAKKDLGNKSPDIGDTFIMRAYFELIKDSTGNYDAVVAKVQEEQAISFNRARRNLARNSTK